jgi:hypothetical protein
MELEDLDTSTTEEICASINTLTEEMFRTSEEIQVTGRRILRRIKANPDWGSSIVLSPKSPMTKWMKTVNFEKETYTFNEFMCFFLDFYAAQDRLDFPTRSLILREEEAKLFDLPAETPVNFFIFMSRMPFVFR